MKLTVINSNSSGNAYILSNDNETLLIECGVRFDRIKKALNYSLRNVVGCIITHSHKDHCFAVHDLIKAGIDVYATYGTHVEMETDKGRKAFIVVPGQQFSLGNFQIKAFDIQHDTKEPVGYMIRHEETGDILFLTDTYYCKYKFPPMHNIIIEANYCQKILDVRLKNGENPKFLRDRVITSHFSIDNCKELLKANDLSKVNNIVLIHLSDGNSDSRRFKKEVEELTGKIVHVAEPGLVIDNFHKQPF